MSREEVKGDENTGISFLSPSSLRNSGTPSPLVTTIAVMGLFSRKVCRHLELLLAAKAVNITDFGDPENLNPVGIELFQAYRSGSSPGF